MATQRQEGVDLASELEKLQRGEVGWDEFFARTRPAWEQLAGRVISRFGRDSEHVASKDDVVQELMLGAWKRFSKYDPERATKSGNKVSLKRYIVWNAMNDAKLAVHKARGASLHGSADRNPSRSPIGESRLPEGTFDRLAVDASATHDAALRHRDVLSQTRNSFERAAVETLLATGDVTQAANALREKRGRRSLRIKNQTEAKRMVRDVVERAASAL